jgi:hypothetical protein
VLDFCNKEGCGRLLSSPEELARDTCRYCLRGLEANTSTFFETFKATMTYSLQSLRPKSTPKTSKRPTLPPPPKAPERVTWEEATKIGGMACTRLRTGVILVNYELIAKNATGHCKVTGEDLTEFLPKYLAEIQLHELIHAIGQIDHTGRQVVKRPKASNKVFSRLQNAMGFEIWAKGWHLQNAKPPCPVIDLDDKPAKVNTDRTPNISEPSPSNLRPQLPEALGYKSYTESPVSSPSYGYGQEHIRESSESKVSRRLHNNPSVSPTRLGSLPESCDTNALNDSSTPDILLSSDKEPSAGQFPDSPQFRLASQVNRKSESNKDFNMATATPKRTLLKPLQPTGGDMDTNLEPDGLDPITRAYLEDGKLAEERAKAGGY